MRETGFDKFLERLTYEAKTRSGLASAGFIVTRLEHIEEHKLTLVTAKARYLGEPLPMRSIRASILRGVRGEGLRIRPEFLSVRRAGDNMVAKLGILESSN